MLDLLLTDGVLIDGTGSPPYPADVGIVGGHIVALGALREREAQQVLDVSGLFVTPGFIDIHAHSDLTLLVDPRAESKVRQGVTTDISGQCGLSAAPLAGEARDELGVWAARFGLEQPSWQLLSDYLEIVERRGVALNFGTLVGHANLRYGVMGSSDRSPTPAEQQAMAGMLAQALEEGALGLSSGLFYAPGSYAELAELVELGRVVAEYGGLYATHIRNEGARLWDALDEAMAVGWASDVAVQISHLKLANRSYWGQAEQVLARLDAARAEGLDLGWDQYPYPAAATTLDAAVPPQFHAGGTAILLERLHDLQDRARIARTITSDTEGDAGIPWENMALDSGWDHIVLSFHPTRHDLTGRTIADIAVARGADPVETALDLILETRAQAEIVDFCMDERDVAAILCHPRTIVATDMEALAAHGPLSAGTPHPRAYGTFPRVLARYVREQELLTWEEAIHKMTGLPAKRLGLRDRGIVREEAWADLVVFDPNTVADTATFTDPHRYPEGIHHVVVNGCLLVRDSVQTDELPGQVLRRH